MIVFIATVNGQHAELREDESWHCARVLRKKPADHVNLIDGEGNFYEAVLENVSDRKCTARIVHGPMEQERPNYRLHLAFAPAKQLDRTEWMLEKAVEIGVQELTPFFSDRSERNILKAERVRKIVESAAKQSLQARLPLIHDSVTFRHLIHHATADQLYIAHCLDRPRKHIRYVPFKNRSTVVLIGPEGDFSPDEITLAEENGFMGLDLGNNRLRSETAGLYICQAASLLSIE